MAVEVQEVREALRKVNDPELDRDLVSLGMIRDIQVDGGNVTVAVELTTPACPLKGQIKADCEQAIRRVAGVEAVEINLSARTRGAKVGEPDKDLLPDVKNVVLVASGKGGVGKSSVAINLAATLARRGAMTGLLDADIYGPSIPTMMGVKRAPDVTVEAGVEKMVPIEAHDVRLMSIGFFVEPAQAVVWRGPMLHKAVQQFVGDVAWGPLDYLIVDVPPGTGDVHISFTQSIRATGAVLVTTPQDVALADVVRGRAMFHNLKVPVLGLVENMSFFVCDGCGKEHNIFARGGGGRAATKLELPLLGEVPLLPSLCEACDDGKPIVAREPDGLAAKAFGEITDRLVGEIAKRAVSSESSQLRLVE